MQQQVLTLFQQDMELNYDDLEQRFADSAPPQNSVLPAGL
jgi:hypothetical protein